MFFFLGGVLKLTPSNNIYITSLFKRRLEGHWDIRLHFISLHVTIKITITLFSENLALGKSAWQQYPISFTRYGAGQAVDGLKTDLSLNGGQCTVSANFKQTAEWRVDLGGIRSINEIYIYYMTNNAPWGMYLQKNPANLNKAYDK